MQLILLKPTSPSKRHYLNIFFNINKKAVLKTKLKKNINSGGRNYFGKITIRHKGYKHNKKLFRIINFQKIKNLFGIIFSIEYDPFRSANIASVFNLNMKKFFYILAPKNIKLGNIIKTGENIDIKIGNSVIIKKIPIGCPIYNISLKPFHISKICRAAGLYGLIINKTLNYCTVILNSGHKINIFNQCFANIGIVSNQFSFLKQFGKAGRSRWLNIRPHVKGTSMNPVDHPNGGGEGRKSQSNKNLWGKKIK